MDPRVLTQVRPFTMLPASLAQVANIDYLMINRLVTNLSLMCILDEFETLWDKQLAVVVNGDLGGVRRNRVLRKEIPQQSDTIGVT